MKTFDTPQNVNAGVTRKVWPFQTAFELQRERGLGQSYKGLSAILYLPQCLTSPVVSLRNFVPFLRSQKGHLWLPGCPADTVGTWCRYCPSWSAGRDVSAVIS